MKTQCLRCGQSSHMVSDCKVPVLPDDRVLAARVNSYALLTKAQEAQLSEHRAQADKYREAIATLQSERNANAALTADIERKDALLRLALETLENHEGNYKLTDAECDVVIAVQDAITKELQ